MKHKTGLGFTPTDFAVFKVEGFSARMQEIYTHVRPKLVRLGAELAPELARELHLEFFPHVARHARRTVNPPPETWAAFGPSPKGYKRYGYLALCISGVGLHARMVVKAEADGRQEMARGFRSEAARLAKSLRGTAIARYDKWDFNALPAETAADDELFTALGEGLGKKTGAIDLGFGWSVRDALRLDRAELLDAYRELEPVYRIVRAAA
ncbi:MAG TPA: DUF1054 family protein [Candidatus Binataceae bacterium]|nr:DUF1054 family protein [Candidatus Binataceae bacterium]